MQGTEDTELTLTREGGFVGSEDDNVEEIKFFEGQFNRITFEQVMNWIGMNFAPQVYNKTLKLRCIPRPSNAPTSSSFTRLTHRSVPDVFPCVF